MGRALRAGIVGLPNAGKSTLFNALTASQVPAEAYPFTTIDPNVGVVEVPEPRLTRLADILRPPRVVPAIVEFVDIAGLVEGAHRGEGLGNRFLARIREVEAIVHVVRCFDDPDVVRPSSSADALQDVEVIDTELPWADLQAVENRLDRIRRLARSGDRAAQGEEGLLDRLREALDSGRAAREAELDEEEETIVRSLFLLTKKPVLYIANITESDLSAGGECAGALRSAVGDRGESLALCCKLEAELLNFEATEREEYLEALGLDSPGVHALIRATYRLLDLITFFTFNEKEVRAWTVRRGARTPEAAGVVHTDFEKGFIRAETVAYEDFRGVGSYKLARDQGLVRAEGRDYVVQDGDILLFRARA